MLQCGATLPHVLARIGLAFPSQTAIVTPQRHASPRITEQHARVICAMGEPTKRLTAP